MNFWKKKLKSDDQKSNPTRNKISQKRTRLGLTPDPKLETTRFQMTWNSIRRGPEWPKIRPKTQKNTRQCSTQNSIRPKPEPWLNNSLIILTRLDPSESELDPTHQIATSTGVDPEAGAGPNFPKNLKNIYNFIIIQNFCVCPLSLIFLFL
jgi:hypothetical protein